MTTFRTRPACVQTLATSNIPVQLMANADVPIEERALAQALLVDDAAVYAESLGGRLTRMVLTPDLHVGPSVPVGVALESKGLLMPQLIGNDIGCGMRMIALDLDADELNEDILDTLESSLRQVFFAGRRQLPLHKQTRLALFEQGLPALLEDSHVVEGAGTWGRINEHILQLIESSHELGSLATKTVNSRIQDWAVQQSVYDGQIGTLGGGNHFCELVRVDAVLDASSAHKHRLRANQLAVVVHAGSLGFGHIGAGVGRESLIRPDGWSLPDSLLFADASKNDMYLSAMNNAANFAFVNRLALAAMAVQAISETLRRPVNVRGIGDMPHNLIWDKGDVFIHRKGACPADGPQTSDKGIGSSVIIPGSMGDYSYLLAGLGNDHMLSSAPHGAGRVLSRTRARASKPEEARHLRVVTPVDVKQLLADGRPDLVEEHYKRVREEAPSAYKPVNAVIESVITAEVATPTARLFPLLTVKGS